VTSTTVLAARLWLLAAAAFAAAFLILLLAARSIASDGSHDAGGHPSGRRIRRARPGDHRPLCGIARRR
jgi:hypothetical protein